MSPAPSLILHGGTLLTQEPAAPVAQALAVADGRLVAVGRDADVLPLSGAGTRRVDLGGATVVPGFNDAHAHIWKIGHLLTGMADLRDVTSLGAMGARLAARRVRLAEGTWLLGRGFNEARLDERRMPTRHDLDAMVPDRPVVLTRTCGHIYACNGAALARAGITRDTPDPPGGVVERDAAGEPTGLLHETAMGLVTRHLPPPTQDDYAAMITAAMRHQLALGITSTNDAGVAPPLLDCYRALDDAGALPSRINVMALRMVDGVGVAPLPARRAGASLRIDTVKFLADGGLSGATAALSVPYRHADTRGVLRFTDDELATLAGEAHHAGYRVAIHAIGDVTIDQVLRLYEAFGPGPMRHRIEHFGLPDAAQLARAAALGVIAVPQAVFLRELGANFRAYLPDAFLPRCYPLRSMLAAGLTVALSSDAPVVAQDDPLVGMRAAIDRADGDDHPLEPAEAIDARAALWAYTMGGAIASGDEANRGSLAPGKWADLAVLDGNPLAVPPARLPSLRVTATLVGGACVHGTLT